MKDIILKHIGNGPGQRVFINGTPGIGKSIYPDVFHYFGFKDSRPSASTFPRTDLFSKLLATSRTNPNTWLDISREFVKFCPVPIIRYMPLWTENELLLAQASCKYEGIDDNRITQSYKIAGGVARFAFQDPNPLASILKAIGDTSANACLTCIGLVGSEREASSKIVHMDSHSPFSAMTMIFGSDLITQMVLFKKLTSLTAIQLVDYFNRPDDVIKFSVGQLYECYVKRCLSTGYKLTIQAKEGYEAPPIDITTNGKNVVFKNVESWKEPDTLYIPLSSTFAGVDLILTPGCLFQVTTAQLHKPLPISDIARYSARLHSLRADVKIYLISLTPKEEKMEILSNLHDTLTSDQKGMINNYKNLLQEIETIKDRVIRESKLNEKRTRLNSIYQEMDSMIMPTEMDIRFKALNSDPQRLFEKENDITQW
eukprot:gene20735-24904_t